MIAKRVTDSPAAPATVGMTGRSAPISPAEHDSLAPMPGKEGFATRDPARNARQAGQVVQASAVTPAQGIARAVAEERADDGRRERRRGR